MRTHSDPMQRAQSLAQIEAEAWVVLEMHFLSRPEMLAQARKRLAHCLHDLTAQGVWDARALKDRACRQVQMEFGPAPALNDDDIAPDPLARRRVA